MATKDAADSLNMAQFEEKYTACKQQLAGEQKARGISAKNLEMLRQENVRLMDGLNRRKQIIQSKVRIETILKKFGLLQGESIMPPEALQLFEETLKRRLNPLPENDDPGRGRVMPIEDGPAGVKESQAKPTAAPKTLQRQVSVKGSLKRLHEDSLQGSADSSLARNLRAGPSVRSDEAEDSSQLPAEVPETQFATQKLVRFSQINADSARSPPHHSSSLESLSSSLVEIYEGLDSGELGSVISPCEDRASSKRLKTSEETRPGRNVADSKADHLSVKGHEPFLNVSGTAMKVTRKTTFRPSQDSAIGTEITTRGEGIRIGTPSPKNQRESRDCHMDDYVPTPVKERNGKREEDVTKGIQPPARGVPSRKDSFGGGIVMGPLVTKATARSKSAMLPASSTSLNRPSRTARNSRTHGSPLRTVVNQAGKQKSELRH